MIKIFISFIVSSFLFFSSINYVNAGCNNIGQVDICSHSYGGGGCGVETAIGCVPVDSGPLGLYLLTWSLSLAGGIAFLFLAYGGFLLITSSGDPKKVQSGKETIMAALSGILFLIFSMFILRLVGVQIFQIQGFG